MARKKTQSHTGFRNGDLFCFNCGRSYNMNLPQSVNIASAMMKQFDKDHKSCPKTWVQPEPDMSWPENERVVFWYKNGERGTSSETIFFTLADKSISYNCKKPIAFSHPHDCDDFRRCHMLLEWVPEWRARLGEMRELNSPQWNNLVLNWDKLTEMLKDQIETGKPNGMYDLMKTLGC